MTREQEIRELRARYIKAVTERKPKTASIIFSRLSQLIARQLRAEVRAERKSA